MSYGTSGDAGMLEAATSNLNVQKAFTKSGIIQHSMADPLLERGNSVVHKNKYEARDAAMRVVHATLVAGLPWLCFTISILFTVWATQSRYPVEFLLMYIIGVSALIFYVTALARSRDGHVSKTKWRRWAGRLTQVAIFFGVSTGVVLYYWHFIFYQAYMGMNTYTNIAVSQPPEQFVDASMITFTSDTALDNTRAVGFKSATQNAMLCVAPVVDSTMGFDQEVHYFAVGVNCCQPRSSFTCDDAGDGSNRNMLLLLEADMLTSPFMEWAVAGSTDRSGFDAAIRMQEAAFGTVRAEKTRLVHWTKDPKAKVQLFRNRGNEAVIISIVVYFFASVLITWHHMFAPKWMSCE